MISFDTTQKCVVVVHNLFDLPPGAIHFCHPVRLGCLKTELLGTGPTPGDIHSCGVQLLKSQLLQLTGRYGTRGSMTKGLGTSSSSF